MNKYLSRYTLLELYTVRMWYFISYFLLYL